MVKSNKHQPGNVISVSYLSQCWKVLCTILEEKGNNQPYSSRNPISYSNNQSDKACPLVTL